MLRAAFRMFDGSYVFHSIPEYLKLGLPMSLGPGLPGIHFTGSKISVSFLPVHYINYSKEIYTHVVIFACKNEELYQIFKSLHCTVHNILHIIILKETKLCASKFPL